jgi:hypothetical protein
MPSRSESPPFTLSAPPVGPPLPTVRRPLVVVDTQRNLLREWIVCPDELLAGPDFPDAPANASHSATLSLAGADISAPQLVSLARERGFHPDCIVVRLDPRNLRVHDIAATGLPSAAIVPDTHHMGATLSAQLGYLARERFGLIVSEFNRQHLHYFHEAGLGPVAWIPAFTLRAFEVDAVERRGIPRAIVVGQVGKMHWYRTHVVEQLRNAGVPLEVQTMLPWEAARAYAAHAVTLNVSLNGDLNLRTFETLAAGGLLLSDRLSPESGIDLLLTEGEHYLTFADVAELRQGLPHLLSRPRSTDAIAAAGFARYREDHQPGAKAAVLRSLLAGGPGHAAYSLAGEPRLLRPTIPLASLLPRVACYEVIQELHRQAPMLIVLALPGTDPALLADLLDLPRLRLFWAAQTPPAVSEPALARMASRIGQAPPDGIMPCDLLLGSEPDFRSPLGLLYLRAKTAQAILVTPKPGATPDAVPIEADTTGSYRLVGMAPAVYLRVP